MKRYKEYMNGIRSTDALHQRLIELKTPEKSPAAWKKYGSIAAAAVLVCGMGAWGLGKSGAWGRFTDQFRPNVIPETVDVAPDVSGKLYDPMAGGEPDVALEEPGGHEPGEKTLGGYDATVGSGPNAMAVHYILPYIEYGDMGNGSVVADWDIPAGAARRDLTREEIIALMGGEDAVNTHLDWGGYELSGWAAWYMDGSFWGAYIKGSLGYYGGGPDDRFEFAVTAGQLPPTCFGYRNSVTQEIRGLTVTADKYDWELGYESTINLPKRRVSFFKDNCGYRFEMCSGDTEQMERMVSRLVCRMADAGLGFDLTNHFAQMRPGICDACGEEIVPGTNHFHLETYTCPDCGQTFVADGMRAHVHSFANGNDSISVEPYDPNADAPVSVSAGPETYVCDVCGKAVPVNGIHFHLIPNGDGTCTCDSCGVTMLEGEKHYHETSDPDETYTCPICGQTLRKGIEHSHELCGYPLYNPEAAGPQDDALPVSVSDSPRSSGEDWCGTPNADPAESWKVCDGLPLAPEGWTRSSNSAD